MLAHLNGGPRLVRGSTRVPADYKECGRSKLIYSEFHHITKCGFLSNTGHPLTAWRAARISSYYYGI